MHMFIHLGRLFGSRTLETLTVVGTPYYMAPEVYIQAHTYARTHTHTLSLTFTLTQSIKRTHSHTYVLHDIFHVHIYANAYNHAPTLT